MRKLGRYEEARRYEEEVQEVEGGSKGMRRLGRYEEEARVV